MPPCLSSDGYRYHKPMVFVSSSFSFISGLIGVLRRKKPAVVASSVQPVSDGWHVVVLRLDQKGSKKAPEKIHAVRQGKER